AVAAVVAAVAAVVTAAAAAAIAIATASLPAARSVVRRMPEPLLPAADDVAALREIAEQHAAVAGERGELALDRGTGGGKADDVVVGDRHPLAVLRILAADPVDGLAEQRQVTLVAVPAACDRDDEVRFVDQGQVTDEAKARVPGRRRVGRPAAG